MANQTLVAGLKEIGRLLIFSLPAALILLLTSNPELAGQYGIPALFILRAIDKGLHDNTETATKGLVPF